MNMITSKLNVFCAKKLSAGLSAGCLLLALAWRTQAAPLTAGEAIPLPVTPGQASANN